MIQKLDKNKDGLISLDEYLADSESKGPKEKRDSIGYHYQHFSNITNYFMIALRSLVKFSILCVPNFIVTYNDYVDRTAMVINVKNNRITYGTNMKEAIQRCILNKSSRFIFFTLILEFSHSNHANIIVIDTKQKTCERFEPHGSTFYFNKRSLKENDNVNKIMDNDVMKRLELQDYKYLSPKYLSPFIGVQAKADSYCGMCVTISMMYLHLRILNPDIVQKKLVKFLMKRDKNKLKTMILKYAKHVENTLKNNEDYVLKLFDEVIDELVFFKN